MISDWTIYGYIGEGAVICPGCLDGRIERKAATVDGGIVFDADTGARWQGLLSLEDNDPEGLTCDDCGEYIFEPDLEYMHHEYGHDGPEPDCRACALEEEARADGWAPPQDWQDPTGYVVGLDDDGNVIFASQRDRWGETDVATWTVGIEYLNITEEAALARVMTPADTVTAPIEWRDEV